MARGVSVRRFGIGMVTAVATVVAYLAGTAQGGSPADAATPGSGPDTTGIAVTGTGTATGVPDELTFSVTVRGRAQDVSAALDQVNASTRDVLAALREQGVAADDVQTTGLSLRPAFKRVDDERIRDGYVATQRLSVVVRDLSAAGTVISAAVEAGGNAVRLGDVRLQIGDKEALLAEARDAAIAEARAKAEQYAEALGRPLGEVVSVREAGAVVPEPVRLDGAFAVDAARVSAAPIRAGTDELRVTVSVRWSFG